MPQLAANVETTPWHTLSEADASAKLQSATNGLSADEAAKRLNQFGPNQLEAAQSISVWTIFFAQFKNVLIVILLVATALSAFLGHAIEAIAITVIVLFAVILGVVQEYRAERAIAALRRMSAPHASVIRDGEEVDIEAWQLVPGDIILLRAGNRIPADCRLLEAVNLHIQESALTGESVAVAKQSTALAQTDLALGDRNNMAYAGTIASYGRGRALVVATGMRTEFGKIAHLLQTLQSEKTPLQQNLDKLGKNLARAALLIVALIVALGLFRGQELIEMLMFGIALAVAVVPEALPAVVTISLALGLQRLVKKNALMRKLSAVETLGSTTVICADKTGTLTKDEMTVRKIFVADQMIEISGAGYEPHGEFSIDGKVGAASESLLQLLRAAALVNDAHIVFSATEERWEIKGDPTEAALVVMAAKAGLLKSELDARFPRQQEIAFSSESKRMTTLHQADQHIVAFAKGAVEVIVKACTSQLCTHGNQALDDNAREKILRIAEQLASEGLRVLALAEKADTDLQNAEHDMLFLGLVGMIDPPRPEAKAAIAICEQAGIRVVMITGDHPVTAKAIARDLGLLKTEQVLTGAQLDELSDQDFIRQVDQIEVYSRVSPAQKLRVVSAFQKHGHIVAMTGDGVNDAPALKKSDIGIAMGITGTDVAKESAAMTLTDDNFASIVAAVEEGRGIFGNIKKYLMFLLSSNIGEIGLMAGATLLGMPLPLTAVQLLYVNLATDGLPALALAVDPPEPDLMQRKPHDQHRGIFTRPVICLMVVGGVWSMLINLGLFTWALQSGRSLAEAMTMTFVSLVLIQFFKAYNFRSDRVSVFHKPFANKWLNISIVWELALLVLIVYLPILHQPFSTFSLTMLDWLIVIALAATVCPVLEIVKWMERRGWLGQMS